MSRSYKHSNYYHYGVFQVAGRVLSGSQQVHNRPSADTTDARTHQQSGILLHFRKLYFAENIDQLVQNTFHSLTDITLSI